MAKNYNREQVSFANINLLGNCNADCFFCLGKDNTLIHGKNQLNIHFAKWKNFGNFLDICEQNNIKKIYITGQTADGLQYKYLDYLVRFLQDDNGFEVGLRSNGYLALDKMDVIKEMNGGIGFTINSLYPVLNKQIMKKDYLPDWDQIIPKSGENVRISIVVNCYNFYEIEEIIEYLSKFPNVRYIQLRRVSVDHRVDEYKVDQEYYDDLLNKFDKNWKEIAPLWNAPRFYVHGKEVVFWATVETTVNSFNYFTDGVISDEYFIVEGYEKNYEKFV